MNKLVYILVCLFLIDNVYSQSCTANAGGDLNIILEHDGIPGGFITFDGSATIGDNLGNFNWNIYHLPLDTLSYNVTGNTPTIEILCYSNSNGDGTWTDCLADYRVELTVVCEDGSVDDDIINLSISEENLPPVPCLTTSFDTCDTNGDGDCLDGAEDNESLLVPNNTGVPGQQTNVALWSYIEFLDCPQPDADLRTWLWYDSDGEQVDPQLPLPEGIHVFTHRVIDPYGTYEEELTLTLELDEYNIIPACDPKQSFLENETNRRQGQSQGQRGATLGTKIGRPHRPKPDHPHLTPLKKHIRSKMKIAFLR